MAKLSEVEEMLEKAEADEKKKKIITGHKNKKEDEAKSGWKVVLEYVRVIAIGALIAFYFASLLSSTLLFQQDQWSARLMLVTAL